ncbi:site-specific integrase, partial [Dysgonomonas sp.]|uniref:site-specific integrase n=2 Tax=unclassified Dysgonomonas TaxID=2630389 RepID=UPI0028A95585
KRVNLDWQKGAINTGFSIPETKEYLLRVRDTFLFACYTGLRHSDLYNLRKSDIIGDRMYITTEKTADNLDIPINKPANNILNKYKDVYFKNDKALPVISVQKMNDYIKELCKLSGINDDIRLVHYKGNQRIETISPKHDLITSHTGRKTFICNSLHLGLSPQTVMKITGHSNYEAMKPYIEITDSDKTIAMSKWDNVNTDKETNNDLLEQLKEIPKEELLKLLSEMNIEANMEPQASATPDKPIAPKNKKKQADSVKQTRLFD